MVLPGSALPHVHGVMLRRRGSAPGSARSAARQSRAPCGCGAATAPRGGNSLSNRLAIPSSFLARSSAGTSPVLIHHLVQYEPPTVGGVVQRGGSHSRRHEVDPRIHHHQGVRGRSVLCRPCRQTLGAAETRTVQHQPQGQQRTVTALLFRVPPLCLGLVFGLAFEKRVGEVVQRHRVTQTEQLRHLLEQVLLDGLPIHPTHRIRLMASKSSSCSHSQRHHPGCPIRPMIDPTATARCRPLNPDLQSP